MEPTVIDSDQTLALAKDKLAALRAQFAELEGGDPGSDNDARLDELEEEITEVDDAINEYEKGAGNANPPTTPKS